MSSDQKCTNSANGGGSHRHAGEIFISPALARTIVSIELAVPQEAKEAAAQLHSSSIQNI